MVVVAGRLVYGIYFDHKTDGRYTREFGFALQQHLKIQLGISFRMIGYGKHTGKFRSE